MGIAEYILWLFELIIGVLIIIFSITYSIPVLFIRRFHHHNNILTVNVCIATIVSCVYWILYYIAMQLDAERTSSEALCAFLTVVQIICTIQVPLSIVAVSIHRFCIIIYHTNTFFRTKRWVFTCILLQWILGILLSLLTLLDIQSVRSFYFKRLRF